MTPWTVAPLSMVFARQQYWSGYCYSSKKKTKTLTSCLVNTRQENEEVKEITTSTQRIHPANLSESGL